LRFFPSLPPLPLHQFERRASAHLLQLDGSFTLVCNLSLTLLLLPSQEHTWSGFAPHRPSRPALLEGTQKLTYYLTSVEPLSPSLTLFRHTCPHAEVQGGLREIDIVWDVSEEVEEKGEEGWFGWFLGKGHRGGRRGDGHLRMSGKGEKVRASPREEGERKKREKEIR